MTEMAFLNDHRRKVDILEQAVVLILYIWFVSRLWPASLAEAKPYVLAILASESMVVVFLLIRRQTEKISINIKDWFVAFAGSFLPLIISKGGEPWFPQVGLVLLIFGFIIHVSAKLSLRRSFGLVAANRGIKVKGMYAYVRHPMYAGYFLTHLGFLLAGPSLWNFIVYASVWFFLIARIYAEERVLSAAPEYQAYKERVRHRIIPGIF